MSKKPLRLYQHEVVEATLASKEDCLATVSVGGGKSLICAEIMERIDGNVICLTMNRELVSQNAAEYKEQGYTNSGIYCAALRKQWGVKCLFASPQSIIGVLKNPNHAITKTPLAAIIVDECHNINDENEKSTYMRIINHYRTLNPKLRVIGVTGTPFRDGENYIVGPDRLFKSSVSDISIEDLIKKDYLVRPIYVNHEGDESHLDGFDFSNCSIDHLGNYKEDELEAAIKRDGRLTSKIMQEVELKTRGKGGTFIFASTIRHCHECLEALPEGSAAIVTGKTPASERTRIMNQARAGKIRFLINVGVLTTGVNLPWFSNVVFVRPTSSRVLYLQAIGRGLRLHTDKRECRVFDYADNYETHGTHTRVPKTTSIRKADEVESLLECPECYFTNKLTARRCRGEQFGEQCEFYFQGKECPKCETTNDYTARYCRMCELELVDPNDKLVIGAKAKSMTFTVNVSEMEINRDRQKRLKIIYTATNGSKFTETVKPESDKMSDRQETNRLFRFFGGNPLEVEYRMVKQLKMVSQGGKLSIVRRIK